jgi:hypothetical protein
MNAFERSRALVRGYGWQVLGTIVLVFLLQIAVDIVIGILLSAVSQDVRGPIASLASGTLVAPFVSLVVTLAYFRLRAAHSVDGGPPSS